MIKAQDQQLTKLSQKPRSSSQAQPGRRKKKRRPTGASVRKHQPIFFWGGLWAIVFLVGITALANLLNPAASKDPQFAQAKVRSSTTIQSATTQSTGGQGQLPVWLFGAIALSCSASSLMLARHLAPVSTHRHRSRQRPKRRC